MGRDVLVIVRPSDRIDQTRAALADLPYTLHFEDVLSYQPRADVPILPDHCQGVIMTSIRAGQSLAAIPSDLRALPLYIVGEASADRARAMGFTKIGAVAPDVEELRQTIRQTCKPAMGGFLYLRGDQVAFDLAGDLDRYGYDVTEHVCYDTTRRDLFSDALSDLLETDRPHAVLFFSRASATYFSNIIMRSGQVEKVQGVSALCLSTPVLECVQTLPWERTYTAKTPDLGAMAELVRTCLVVEGLNEGQIANDDAKRPKRTYSER